MKTASRRTHTKSRNGCQQCRDGHVKCDEKRPVCSLCVKRQRACTYLPPKVPSTRASPSTPRSNESEVENKAIGESRPSDRLYEMRLFHHFTTKTSYTLCSNARDRYLWETVVPHFATSCNHVMDSVLAISALHLAFIKPEDSQSYLCSALDYYNKALAGSLSSANPGNMDDADACAVCSICILVAATAYSNNSHERYQRDPLDDVLEKRRILQGTRFFMRGLDRSSMHPLIEEWCYGDAAKGEKIRLPTPEESDPKLKSLHGEVLERLEQLGSELEETSPPDKEILQTAHRLLKESIQGWPVSSGVMNWTLEVSAEYIQLLKQGDWLARVLLMFYGLGLHLSSNRWVFQNSGRSLIKAILPRKSEIDSRWEDLITWIGQLLG